MHTFSRIAVACAFVVLGTTVAFAEVRRASEINIDDVSGATPEQLQAQYPGLSDPERALLLFRIADARSLRS